MRDESPVQALRRLSRSFGAAPARRKARLLHAIARIPRLPARELVRLQEALCFMRASPDDAEVLRGVVRAAARLRDQHRGAAGLINTGVPGSANSYPYSYPVVQKLVRLFPGCLEIDWEEAEETGPLEGALAVLSTVGEGLGLDDERLSIREWLARAKPRRLETDLEYILERLERSSFSAKAQAHLFDVCGLPVRFALELPGSGLAEVSLRPGRVHYQRRDIVRQRFDIASRIPRPLARLPRAGETIGSKIINLALAALSIRNLEIYPLSHANPRDVTLLDCGRGLEIAIVGVVPEFRSSLESLFFFLVLKNGVPVGYGPASVFMGCCEMGFNLFPEFRGIAVRPIYAELMRMLRHVLGVRYYFLTRYGMGEDNEDAIRSGAFWFYRKLGFKTTSPKVEALARAEEDRMRAEPGYLSDRTVLRRLSHTEAVLDLSDGRCRPMDFGKLGFLETRYIEERFAGDRARAQRVSASRMARLLGVADNGEGLRRLSPLLSLIPKLSAWSRNDKARLARALSAKDGASEIAAANLFRGHQTLRRALLRLAEGPGEIPTSSGRSR